MQIIKDQSIKDQMAEAKNAESNREFEKAVTFYKNIIEKDPLHEQAYDRLFMMLRKLKDYKQELKMIKIAIKSFEDHEKEGKKKSRKITDLSAALAKATGLTDKKGRSVYKPEPVASWEKRKAIVEKKI